MAQRYIAADDPTEPSIRCRFKVEAAMLEMIEGLQRQGLGSAEIALSLADAAEDYVLRLAKTEEEQQFDDVPRGLGH
jgi:hypothetical protein